MTVSESLESGRLATLKAMRDLLANELDNAIPMNVSAIAARLQSVLEQIDDIEPARAGDLIDELANRRQNNRSATAERSAPTARERRPTKSG